MAHVLVVEDEKDLGSVIQRALETWGHTSDWARDGRRALDLVFKADKDYDLILCDLHLPGMTGAAFFSEAQSLLRWRTPVVIMSGVDYMLEALGELRRGALTVLEKPFHLPVLQETVARGLDQRAVYARVLTLEGRERELSRRNEILLEQNAELFEQARQDPLTDLPNRRRLWEDLDVVEANARRYRSNFALALVDVDDFGRFNRDVGVARGDDVLRLVATTIREACRQGDLLYRPVDPVPRSAYRFGGDEFVLVLAAQDAAGAVQALDRVRERVIEVQGPDPSPDHVVTVSIGVAANDVAAPHTVEELLAQADDQLKAAKLAGGNCVRPKVDAPPQAVPPSAAAGGDARDRRRRR